MDNYHMKNWPFSDPKNKAVITTKKILSGRDYIRYVTHDIDDGSWQFLNIQSYELSENDAAVVGLDEITELDPSIVELADLPLCWSASRDTEKSKWIRAQIA